MLMKRLRQHIKNGPQNYVTRDGQDESHREERPIDYLLLSPSYRTRIHASDDPRYEP